MRIDRRVSRERRGERGHLLVGLVVLLACMMIMLTAAAQSWTFLVRRDREAELIAHGEEYANAIAFYQKEVGSYPLKLDLLEKKGPHGHRFIRRLYKDPVADDGEWGLLFLSPTGQGFINPYATQLGEGFLGGDMPMDPFASGGGIPGLGNGGGGGFGKKGSGRKGFGGSGKEGKKPGYSELDQQTYKALEGAVMPIVGVVHKKEEWGIKNYKSQAMLNDWAFTLLDEGEQHKKGGKGQHPAPRTGPPRRGVGDSHNPIFLPGMVAPKPKGKDLINKMRDDLSAYNEELMRKEQERLAAEEARVEGEEGDETADEEDEGEEGADDDPDGEGENDEGSDEDPNGSGEDDEGSDEDPNGGGEDQDPNGAGEDDDPNGNGRA